MARAKGARKGARSVRSIDFGAALPKIDEAAWLRRMTLSGYAREVMEKDADRVLARQRRAAPDVAAA
jgi:hypothetical protein